DNGSSYRSSVGDENAADFALDEVDNVAVAISGKEEDGNNTKTKVWDLDEHGSLVGSNEDEEHEDGERRRSNAIRNYSKECRRQRKFLKNESKRVVVRCIASPKCQWRILASYNPIAKYLQVKTFKEEHHCLTNEAKEVVKEKMAGNYEKFGQLYNYTHESRSKMSGSTIKMIVQRVTVDSPPHFKRPLIGLDGCFLKGPFKSEFLTTVGRDANNQMFPIAWAVVEGLQIVIFDISPKVEHRNYVRDMFANWSGRKLEKSYEYDFLADCEFHD
ncbi:hypothetical protein Godav_029880, partial [Gossypium davidsonii]|nr:hypothetical protein [Gossypium davidsonii]